MKVRIIAVLLAAACATLIPALAQQPTAPTQSTPTQAAPNAPAPASSDAARSCCGSSCDMAKHDGNSADAEHYHADCCARKDAQAMSCCQSKDSKSAVACCNKDDKSKDPKSAMDCSKGHGSDMCAAKGQKGCCDPAHAKDGSSCCDGADMAEHCKAHASGR